jgi:hypothetical protein
MSYKIPENIIKILNGECVKNEKMLYQNDNFILLIDPKNKKKISLYCLV